MPRLLSTRSKSYFFFILSLGLVGCSQPPKPEEAVTIQLPTVTNSLPASYLPAKTDSLASSRGLVGSPNFPKIDPNSAAGEWVIATNVERQSDAKELSARLEIPLQQVREDEKARNAVKVQEFQTELSDRADKDRRDFVAALREHGEAVGYKRSDLAWLVGFPDPDPLSKRQPASQDLNARRHFPEVKSLRNEIAESESSFDAKWKSELKKRSSDRNSSVTALQSQLDQESEKRVAQEREKLSEQALKTFAIPIRRGNPVAAPAAIKSNVSGVTQGLSLSFPQAQIAASVPDETWIKRRLAIFLENRHYRIAKSGEKGRDVTSEFNEWMKRFEAGK